MKTYVTEAIEALKTLLRKEIAAAALAAVPIGACIFYLGTEIPDGFLLMNGASVAKADFDDLYDVIGNKFGNVDSDHFNLPDTHHRFLEGTTNIAEVGATSPRDYRILRATLRLLQRMISVPLAAGLVFMPETIQTIKGLFRLQHQEIGKPIRL